MKILHEYIIIFTNNNTIIPEIITCICNYNICKWLMMPFNLIVWRITVPYLFQFRISQSL